MERDGLMMDQRLKWIKFRIIYFLFSLSIQSTETEDGERINKNDSYVNTYTLVFE